MIKAENQAGESFRRGRRWLESCLLAAATIGAALIVTSIISPFVGNSSSPFFLIAVMICAWRGGLTAGFLATLLATAANLLIFLPPSSPAVAREDLSQLAVDIFASVVIGTLSAGRRRAETEREKLLKSEQAARIEAENASRVKDEFIAAVSHELRTPLTTIKTLTRVLLHKNPNEIERRESLADIAAECDRQIDFVNNLLDLSHIKSGGVPIKSEPVDIAELAAACVKMKRVVAAEYNHEITLESESAAMFAVADKNALRRVLRAILENAVKYTPDGGLIRVRVFAVETERIVVEIADNGRGIRAADVPHIFESFYRGSSTAGETAGAGEGEIPGVGLGLYLAQNLIEAMNGTIEVESEIGVGSCFRLSLPAQKAEIEKPSEPNRAAIQATPFPRIL